VLEENGNVVDNHPVDIFLKTQSSSLQKGPVVIKPCSDLKYDCFCNTFLQASIVSISLPILFNFSSVFQ